MRGFSVTLGSVIGLVVVAALVLVGLPTYNVYSKQMQGKAAYEEAVQNRRIRVLEAQAALDSAQLNAQAEVARARGTNEANRIMAESLGGPENYLRWASRKPPASPAAKRSTSRPRPACRSSKRAGSRGVRRSRGSNLRQPQVMVVIAEVRIRTDGLHRR